MTTLTRLQQQFPGLEAMLEALCGYFKRQPQDFLQKVESQLKLSPYERWESACKNWVEVGILPDLEIRTDQQVGAVWTNPLFQVVLDHGAEFSPPPDLDLSRHFPAAVGSYEEMRDRALECQRLQSSRPYWKTVLELVYPEIYLEPFLDWNETPIRGCDIACGWGRASLSMRRWDHLTLKAVDLSEEGLACYRNHAQRLGVLPKIETVVADLVKLPIADSSMDFLLAFDIFEHLTDATLEAVLDQLLRVSKMGAVLYTEIPLNDYFPPITHIQDFSFERVLDVFQSHQAGGKTFTPIKYRVEMPFQFSFAVVPVGAVERL